jgi:hypothetical protein
MNCIANLPIVRSAMERVKGSAFFAITRVNILGACPSRIEIRG